MSYAPLLRSLANTPKGDDDWRTILGTLLRQAFNEGRLPSKRRVAADLRSVGWGGRDQEIRRAYDVMTQVFTISVARDSQRRTDLNSFNTQPSQSWRKTERGNANRFISHATVITIPEGSSGPNVKLWGSNTKRLPTVYEALVDIRQAYDQGTNYLESIGEADRYRETIVTYEYAGVRRIVRR